MRRTLSVISVVILTSVFCISQQQPAPSAPAANTQAPLDPEIQKDKTYALEQVRAGKKLDVLNLLTRLHAQIAKDCEVGMALGDALLAKSAALEGDAEKAGRVAARKTYKEVNDAGCDIEFARQMVNAIPEDGARAAFSDNAEVERLIKKGEAAFGAGKYDEAKDWYIKAVVLDPKNFNAALYAGDTYFAKKDYVSACEWFQRATEIDPTKEVAHRYWGDALMDRKLYGDAKKQYIEALIADPYSHFVTNGINNYLRGTGQKARWYKIKPQADITSKDGRNINITLDAGDKDAEASTAAWMMYGIMKAAYHGEGFAKHFPAEKTYRNSLEEEAGALDAAAVGAASSAKDHKNKPLPDDLAELVQLKTAGFIEPYVLLNVAGNDISKDYDAYRKAHRDVLVHYLSDFVLLPAPPNGKTD